MFNPLFFTHRTIFPPTLICLRRRQTSRAQSAYIPFELSGLVRRFPAFDERFSVRPLHSINADPAFDDFEPANNAGCTGPGWEFDAGILLLVGYMLIMSILM